MTPLRREELKTEAVVSRLDAEIAQVVMSPRELHNLIDQIQAVEVLNAQLNLANEALRAELASLRAPRERVEVIVDDR